ncbi:serine hydrolase domain-containing protein [Candidatus Neomarinimicrobiota bacterium]
MLVNKTSPIIPIRIFIILLFSLLLSCSLDQSLVKFIPNHDWDEAKPEDVGLRSESLENAFTTAMNTQFVDGLLVVRNGKLVGERYYNGYDKFSPHNVKSVSKSFLSALTGIALQEGIINDLNQKVIPFFSDYVLSNIDPRLNDLIIRDLLMMRMGIVHERQNYMQIYNSPSWIQTTLDLELIDDPGTVFHYNTYQTHLLSAILTRQSGMNTFELCEEYLADPIQVTIHDWHTGPEGYYFGGNSMFFTPRDMAVLGYLYLNDGMINGNQIVPESWVTESTTDYTQFKNRSWGSLHNYNYSYLWWLGEIGGYEVFLAIGYGGQFIINFPELDMIVVSTAKEELSWNDADVQERAILKIVADHIIPAVIN